MGQNQHVIDSSFDDLYHALVHEISVSGRFLVKVSWEDLCTPQYTVTESGVRILRGVTYTGTTGSPLYIMRLRCIPMYS